MPGTFLETGFFITLKCLSLAMNCCFHICIFRVEFYIVYAVIGGYLAFDVYYNRSV